MPAQRLTSVQAKPTSATTAPGFLWSIVGMVSLAHLLNDLMQAMLPAIYPLLKSEFSLSFTQVGVIVLAYQLTASLLQPWIGLYTDKHPKPYLLPLGMVATLLGIVAIALAGSYVMLLLSVCLIGIGSATFHPEASRVARLASGGRLGTAQSTFQVGGNAGTALGPLLVAAMVLPYGQGAMSTFALFAVLATAILSHVAHWQRFHAPASPGGRSAQAEHGMRRGRVVQALVVIAVLMFTKFIYIAAFKNYFTFYLLSRFDVSMQTAQLYLFAYLAAVAVGTFAGGPIGDRLGRKSVIWISFLGVIPFALLLPHANLLWTAILAILVGLVLSSAFAAMVVYAQELLPGRVGMVSGLMFGLMFGLAGIGAAGLGSLADWIGIIRVYQLWAYLPLLGLVTALLPDITRSRA